MNMKKNHNLKYYMLFSFFHLFLLLYVLYKKKDRKTIFFTFLSIVGLAFYFEYPLYILKAYKYKTNLVKNKEQDNSFGSVLSQGLFVPSVAIFISSFQLGWKMKFLFTMYFTFIERLFIKLNIFKNRWWHTIYTIISIFTYFFISDAWYKGLKNGNKFITKMTQFNIFHVIYMNLFFILSILKKFKFTPIRFTTKSWYYHYSFVKVYLIFETCLTIYFSEKKNKGLKILPFLIILMMDSFFKKISYLKVKGSYWAYVFPVRALSHLALYVLQKRNKLLVNE
ncbi:hypothetical protein ACJ2A9_17300 [Anaerobacillus sp. MEB173]|uniref:hypothetical protein n=1 Tax=Anaerobacillus sp. MEB173 TaxID=3383345 RepID=UPI003F9314B9